ncbi:MAG TPA: sigma factor-like helix-turn-helix DNA-binding protein [Pseudonocardia sp.]|nr:sigma factor-like helix-turn-helix DNA-binding protein [Pseudonocardia sp.]
MRLTVDTRLPTQVTPESAADSAGARGVDVRLMAEVRPAVTRYCRARLGGAERAADLARAVCRTILAKAPATADEAVLTAFVYRTVAAAVDAAEPGGLPVPLAQLPPAEREVLVLRVAVGLSLERTAAALGAAPEDVRRVQHHAMQLLRRAQPSTATARPRM